MENDTRSKCSELTSGSKLVDHSLQDLGKKYVVPGIEPGLPHAMQVLHLLHSLFYSQRAPLIQSSFSSDFCSKDSLIHTLYNKHHSIMKESVQGPVLFIDLLVWGPHLVVYRV